MNRKEGKKLTSRLQIMLNRHESAGSADRAASGGAGTRGGAIERGAAAAGRAAEVRSGARGRRPVGVDVGGAWGQEWRSVGRRRVGVASLARSSHFVRFVSRVQDVWIRTRTSRAGLEDALLVEVPGLQESFQF
jgi:hypothetical protein